MNPVRRFFRRYIFSTMGILMLFLAVNFVLFAGIMIAGYENSREESFSIRAFSERVTRREGVWTADDTALDMLRENRAWAMILDPKGAVVWERDMPPELPRSYTSAQVASFSRWYLEGYPVRVWAGEDGFLTVAGFQPGTRVKFYYDLPFPYVRFMVMGGIGIFCANLGILLFLTLKNARRVERAMSPILQGIQDLGRGKPRRLEEKGELAEISAGLNRAGDYMMKKDNTRAEWIRGVSHDIRTPLSMVLGYAGELEEDRDLPPAARQQAGIIRRQGEKMRALVENLNLTTRLDYGLLSVGREETDCVEIGRQAVSELLNEGLPDRYEILFFEECPGKTVRMTGDPALLRRMLDNLIRNSVVHNPEGCRILVSVGSETGTCAFLVRDGGIGISDDRMAALNGERDISSTREGAGETEHGLGLKIVRQIAAIHGGTVRFERALPHGLSVRIAFPAR